MADEIKGLSKELEDLILAARKATSELLAAARAGQGVEGKPQAGNVNRPGVAGAAGSGGPITGPGGHAGHISPTHVISTGMALHHITQSVNARRGANPWEETENAFKANVQAAESAKFKEYQKYYGDTSYERAMKWHINQVMGGGVKGAPAATQEAAFLWHARNPATDLRYRTNLYTYQQHAFSHHRMGPDLLTRGAKAIDKFQANEIAQWTSLLPSEGGPAAEATDAGLWAGMSAWKAGIRSVALTKTPSLLAMKNFATGPVGQTAAAVAKGGFDWWYADQDYQRQKYAFQGDRDTLVRRLAERRASSEHGYNKLKAALTGGGAIAGAVFGGPIGASIGAGAGYLAGWAGEKAPIVTGYIGRPFGQEWGTFREEQENRRLAIRNLFEKYSLGDMKARGPHGRPLTPEERAQKYLADANWTEEAFRNNLGLSLRESSEALKQLSMGNLSGRIQEGEFKGRMVADLAKAADERIKGTCPNWSRPHEIYQMFEAGRNASRNFAKAMGSRGALRTGD